MNRMWATRVVFIVAFVIALSVFIAVHFLSFPGSVPDFAKSSGGGVLLDMKPEFSQDGTYQRLAGYGEAGRANYSFRNVTSDVLLPLGLLPFLLLLMSRAVNMSSMGKATRMTLLALPLAYALLDLAENASVLALLSRFPERLPLTSAVLPYLTVLKRAASLLSIFLPLLIMSFVFTRSRLGRTKN